MKLRYFGDAGAEVTPMVFNDSQSYQNFKQCFDEKLKMEMAQSPAIYYKVQQMIDSGGFEMLEYLEKNFNCASFCEVPFFYFTKNVST